MTAKEILPIDGASVSGRNLQQLSLSFSVSVFLVFLFLVFCLFLLINIILRDFLLL